MDDDTLFAWTTEHRLLFADALDQLGEDHAGDPTLREGWDVRTLAGHLLQPIRVPSWRFLLTAARVRSMARACDVIAARLSDRPLAEISAELRERAGEQSRPMYIGPAGPYADSCIHLRDLARPQRLDVTVPVDRWLAVLDIVVSKRGQESFLPGNGHLDGLRWVSSDATWTWGAGPEVCGTAEALAMVASGRGVYLDQIQGAGEPELRRRLTGRRDDDAGQIGRD